MKTLSPHSTERKNSISITRTLVRAQYLHVHHCTTNQIAHLSHCFIFNAAQKRSFSIPLGGTSFKSQRNCVFKENCFRQNFYDDKSVSYCMKICISQCASSTSKASNHVHLSVENVFVYAQIGPFETRNLQRTSNSHLFYVEF